MNYQRLTSIFVGVLLTTATLAPFHPAAALGAASMTLTGASNTTGSFSVVVFENTGSDTVTGANVVLDFSAPVSNVTYDYSVGPFVATTPSGAHNAYGTVTGSQPVARVSFTLANPGAVTTTVGAASYLKHVEGATIENFAINRGTATFTYTMAAAATPAPTVAAPTQPANNQTGKTSSTSTSKAKATPTSTTPTPTVESQVMGTEVTNDQATVSAVPSVTPTPAQTKTQSASSKLPWVAGGAIVILIVAAAAYWFFRKK